MTLGNISKSCRLGRKTNPARAIFVVLMLLSSSHVAGAQSRGGSTPLSASLQQLFAEGVRAEKAGRLDEAEKIFLRVLHEGGKVSFVYNNLGTVYQQRGEHERAIAQFQEAIRLRPDFAAPRILMGASLLALGKTAQAVRELESGVKLLPQEPLARQELARAYERAGNPAGAVEQYRALRELAPREPEYAYQLGSAYLKLAGWCYEQLLRAGPRSARAYQMRGENFRDQGRTDLALRAFHLAAQADPTLAGIHLAMGEIYLAQGKTLEAGKEVDWELAIVPDSVAALELKKQIESTGQR